MVTFTMIPNLWPLYTPFLVICATEWNSKWPKWICWTNKLYIKSVTRLWETLSVAWKFCRRKTECLYQAKILCPIIGSKQLLLIDLLGSYHLWYLIFLITVAAYLVWKEEQRLGSHWLRFFSACSNWQHRSLYSCISC